MVTSWSSGSVSISQHVGPPRGEALVVGHVIAGHSGADLADHRDRLIRVADVLVESGIGGGSGRMTAFRPRTSRVRERSGTLGRPGIEAAPFVSCRSRTARPWGSGCRAVGFKPSPLSFQVYERRTAARCARDKTRRSSSQSSGCPSLSPSRCDQPPCGHGPITSVLGAVRAILFQRVKELQRSGEILGIEPSADKQHRRRHVLHVRRQRARAPELVVCGMLQACPSR